MFQRIGGSEQRKVVGSIVAQATFAAQQVADFFHRLADDFRIFGLRENYVMFLVGIEFAQRGDGHDGNVVFGIGTAGETLATLLQCADDGEELSVTMMTSLPTASEVPSGNNVLAVS